MKKQIIIAVSAFLMAGFQILQAQNNLIQITPIPLTGKTSFQYQRKVSPRQTIVAEYQFWGAKRSSSNAFVLPGFFSSGSREVRVDGKRFQIGTRLYAKEAFNGWFMEGGIHWGKFDITKKEESNYLNVWGLWSGNDILGFDTKITRMENVKAGGVKLGGGFQKRKGAFSIDLSSGMEFNIQHSREISALTGMLNFGRPYARMSVGFVF